MNEFIIIGWTDGESVRHTTIKLDAQGLWLGCVDGPKYIYISYREKERGLGLSKYILCKLQ